MRVRIYWGGGAVVVDVADALTAAQLWKAATALGGEPAKIEKAETDEEIVKP